MKYAVEHWRRSMPRTMGTLYWQLNDCWPVASWSSIDYLKRWKALHYMARRFYAPLLVSGVEDLKSGRVEAHATSDLLRACEGVLSWRVTSVAGESLETGSCPVRLPARTSRRVRTLDLKPHLDARGPRDLLLWLDLSVRGRSVSARPRHLRATEAPGTRGPGSQSRRLARRSRRLPRRSHRRPPGALGLARTLRRRRALLRQLLSSSAAAARRGPRRAVAGALVGRVPAATPSAEPEGHLSLIWRRRTDSNRG